ncbi:DUF6323 family protein [Pelosinus baikalensis]|uniref:DUF6323 family protein n=1 Tax=Pelosinus baikalensis TaxID=2892015 RepID=A0ABS8HZR7_9FIRM|nr:DUF6323 family protein [Pelosinus baikalensis]MCC5468658.1 DUF6323 family protein [Pelosinus baikalensis]
MAFELALFSQNLIQKQALNEIVKCNDLTINYGLVLTPQQAVELVETRNLALRDTGRIEFGGGVIDKIIYEFCDSPYISMHNYAETLHELTELFYYFKNETLDLISDDDLIKYMGKAFNGVCQGSLDLLSGRELDRMARNLRYGRDADYSEDTTSEDEEEEDEDGEY